MIYARGVKDLLCNPRYLMTLMSTGRGIPTYPPLSPPDVPLGPVQYAKGLGSQASGRAVFPAGATTLNVTVAIARAPRPGEVMLTPACDHSPRSLWLGALHGRGFVAHLSAALDVDCAVDYRVALGSL